MKNHVTLISLIILAIIISGCTITGRATETPDQPIKIGLMTPLTGDVAILGQEVKKGVELAEEEINKQGGIDGKKLVVIYEDDKYSTREGVTIFKKFVNIDQVNAVLTTTVGPTLALKDDAKKHEVPIIEILDSNEDIANAGDWVFGTGIYTKNIGFVIAESAYELFKPKKIGILYTLVDPFYSIVKDGLIEKINSIDPNIEILLEPYQVGRTDFRSQLLKLKDADVIVLLGTDEAGIALRQAKEISISAHFFGIDTATSEGFIKNAGVAIKNLYFTFWESPNPELYNHLNRLYKKDYNQEMISPMFVALGYDGLWLIAKSMKGGNYNGDSLRRAIANKEPYPGITALITIDPDGINRNSREILFKMIDEKGNFVKYE